jgi:hypothetical protein
MFGRSEARQERQTTPKALWSGLDNAWQEAFRKPGRHSARAI